MAIAEAYLSARYNRPGFDIINHFTYALVSDGDLMEGVGAESASLAGHLKLGKLIYLYDDNLITLSASTQLTFTEDHAKRFESYGWHTQTVSNGNDLEAIEKAIQIARKETERPSLILVRTHIGYGSPNKQDTFEAHGSPLGVEEVRLTKQNLNWPLDPPFYVPGEVESHFRQALDQGLKAEDEWKAMFTAYENQYPELANELNQLINEELPLGWNSKIPQFPADPKGMATRMASAKTLESFNQKVPGLIGGSADLNPSTFTELKGEGNFSHPSMAIGDLQGSSEGGWSYAGRNIQFGVREHGMGAILNGMAAHGGIIPFGSTFLTFSDYMRPSIRLAALMGLHVIYVFTHDSIGMGEDGPTHQPIEHLASLRSIPGLIVIRPCDANETTVAWRYAMEQMGRPVALILSRQNVPTLDREEFAAEEGLLRGAYILEDTPDEKPELILIASGSEVGLIVASKEKLKEQKISVRLVSMPSWELFEDQSLEYRESVLPPNVPAKLVVEAGSTQGWQKYAGDLGYIIGIDHFGASAPGPVLQREFGFTVEDICASALSLLDVSNNDE
jgi:transketolase